MPSRPGNAFTGWRVILRQLVASPSVTATTFVTVFITGLFIIGAPLFLEVLSQRALVDVVTTADPAVKNIGVSRTTTVPVLSGETPFQRVNAFATEFQEREFGPNTSPLVESVEQVVGSPRFMVSSGPDGPLRNPTFLRLRHQSNVTDRITLVEGHMPTQRDAALAFVGPECDSSPFSPDGRPATSEPRGPRLPVDCAVAEIPLFEAAFSLRTLQEMGLEVGDRMSISPDATDFAAFGNVPANMLDYRVFVEVSGVISPTDNDDAYWFGDVALERPTLIENADFEIVHATGLASPEAYRQMLEAFRPANWHYRWRYFIDEEVLDPDQLQDVRAELRALQAGFPPASPFDPGQPSVSTGLPDLIDVFFDQRRLAYSTLAMSGAGLLITSTAVVLLMAALASERDRTSLILLRGRGGTAGQLLIARSAQALLLVAPAVALSYVSARAVLPETSRLADLGVVALTSTSMGVFVAAVLPFTRPALGQLLSRSNRPSSSSIRRIVGESLIVVVAVGATLLMRRRFQAGPAPDEPFDLMLAIAPIALGTAVGIVTFRLLAIPTRTLALVASRRRGPVLFVGLRRVLQLPPVARLPAIAVVAAVSLSVFSSVVQVSIIDGQVESTFRSVGADYSVTPRASGDQLSSDYGLANIDSVTALARVTRLPGLSVRLESDENIVSEDLELIALEIASYQEVTRDTTADLGLPVDALTEESSDGSPLPILVSRSWPGGPGVGSFLTLTGNGVNQSFEVVGRLDQFPGVVSTPFAIVDLSALESSVGRQLATTGFYLAAPPSAADSIRSAVDLRSGNAVVRSQSAELGLARQRPFVTGVILALVVATGMAAVLGVTAAIGSLALTEPDRRRDLGYLRTLGLSPRQALGMTTLEQVPTITLAAVVGSLLGIGLVVIFEPGLDLIALTGPGVTDVVKLQPGTIGLITTALIATMAIAVVLSAAMVRRQNLGQLLRMGDE